MTAIMIAMTLNKVIARKLVNFVISTSDTFTAVHHTKTKLAIKATVSYIAKIAPSQKARIFPLKPLRGILKFLQNLGAIVREL